MADGLISKELLRMCLDEFMKMTEKARNEPGAGLMVYAMDGAESAIRSLRDGLDKFPSVDAAPIVHGTWVEVKPRGWHTKGFFETAMIACSECHNEPAPHVESSHEHGGTVTSYRWLKTKHCPNCGAKMDAKEGA